MQVKRQMKVPYCNSVQIRIAKLELKHFPALFHSQKQSRC